MLEVSIPSGEFYDEASGEFVYTKPQIIKLEHSLVSISKWESKWKKPYLVPEPKTAEESIDYVRCMTITQNVDPLSYLRIPQEAQRAIAAYLEDPMTATKLKKLPGGRHNKETPTSELIYYWMITLDIPHEYEKWNLNRLLVLIELCNRKNEPAKKMSKKEILTQQAIENEKRLKRFNTRG